MFLESRPGDGPGGLDGFYHDALLYAGPAEYADRLVPFIVDGLKAGEPVLVVVVPEKIDVLRDALGDDAARVAFEDMAAVGRNPSRIIPVWREFIAANAVAGGRVRGIGEPIWASRSPEELVESQRHEALINLAFAGAPGWIVCPYDTEALTPDVIEEAYRSHPAVVDGRGRMGSPGWAGLAAIPETFSHPLPVPLSRVDEMPIALENLEHIRGFVRARCAALGLDGAREEDMVVAVNEVASNSVRHGGGGGILRIWGEPGSIVCEIEDAGTIDDPLVGRQRPASAQEGGIGLWLVNQLCDLVQVRSSERGTTVRLHMSVPSLA